jgi:ribosomal protein S18 acetylase RimI-like enzyme
MAFEQNASDAKIIYAHLKACDETFIPPLSQRVIIKDYAEKLFRFAERFEYFEENTLIGLLALYCNDPKKETAFISNLSVLEKWQKRGIAKKLLNSAIDFLQEKQFKKVSLETDINNFHAIHFYKKQSFKVIKTSPLVITLERDLT